MTTIIRCAGHAFRPRTWGQDRCNDVGHYVCKGCGFVVKTRKARDYFEGKVS